jgi:hypothetical protein
MAWLACDWSAFSALCGRVGYGAREPNVAVAGTLGCLRTITGSN